MPMLRGNALRSLQSSLRHSSARATARVAAPARTQLVAKRFASSGGHGGHGEASSDIPWLIGALVVTPPTMWYLWPAPHDDHHEEHGHEEHGEEEKPSEEDQSAEGEAPQEEAAPAEQSDGPAKGSQEDGKDEKSGEDDKSSDDKSDSDGTVEKEGAPDKDPNAGSAQFKGKVAEGSAAQIDERKSEPRPSKDSRVKRIDSGLGKNLGEGPTHDEDDPKKESQATSKEASSDSGDITNKQKGLSTTDTKHSEQIDQDSEKSKKGTGEPETAKAKGTVDPKAPVR